LKKCLLLVDNNLPHCPHFHIIWGCSCKKWTQEAYSTPFFTLLWCSIWNLSVNSISHQCLFWRSLNLFRILWLFLSLAPHSYFMISFRSSLAGWKELDLLSLSFQHYISHLTTCMTLDKLLNLFEHQIYLFVSNFSVCIYCAFILPRL
jgi:hypothetical protein